MHQETLVSVIVPVFNAEKYIEKCVSSIAAQTHGALEILLVDDGSRDKTPAILDKLALGDARIRVLRKENGGAASARNFGISHAQGEYIGFVDADDLIEPDMYENLLAGFADAEKEGRDPGRILVQTGRRETDEGGNPLPDDVTPPAKNTFVPSEAFMESLLLWRGDSSFCTKLAPRALFDTHRFPEGRLGEDFRLHMEMLPDLEGVYLLPARGYLVTHRAGSATRRKSPEDFSRAYEDIIVHADAAAAQADAHFPSLREAADHFGLRTRLLYLLHVPVDDMNESNAFYRGVVRYLRESGEKIRKDPYLTKKERQQLLVLSRAPRLARRAHRLLRGMRI